MASSYRIWISPEERVDIDAARFEIQEGGTLVFFEDEDATLTAGPKPFSAYSEWNSVSKK